MTGVFPLKTPVLYLSLGISSGAAKSHPFPQFTNGSEFLLQPSFQGFVVLKMLHMQKNAKLPSMPGKI